MDKEKEIEELNNTIADFCIDLVDQYCGTEQCCTIYMSRHLIEAGYRKADEVRKETAKEILQDLYDEASKYCDETMGLNTYEIKQLAKKYGVEVENDLRT